MVRMLGMCSVANVVRVVVGLCSPVMLSIIKMIVSVSGVSMRVLAITCLLVVSVG